MKYFQNIVHCANTCSLSDPPCKTIARYYQQGTHIGENVMWHHYYCSWIVQVGWSIHGCIDPLVLGEYHGQVVPKWSQNLQKQFHGFFNTHFGTSMMEHVEWWGKLGRRWQARSLGGDVA